MLKQVVGQYKRPATPKISVLLDIHRALFEEVGFYSSVNACCYYYAWDILDV